MQATAKITLAKLIGTFFISPEGIYSVGTVLKTMLLQTHSNRIDVCKQFAQIDKKRKDDRDNTEIVANLKCFEMVKVHQTQ